MRESWWDAGAAPLTAKAASTAQLNARPRTENLRLTRVEPFDRSTRLPQHRTDT